MVRKQIAVERWQADLLRKKAKELSVSQAQLLRIVLPFIAELKSADGVDELLWERAAETFEGMRTRRANEIARGWSRDDLYDDLSPQWPARPWIERV